MIQQELNKPNFQLQPLSRDDTDEDVIVRISQTGFTFRARILEGSFLCLVFLRNKVKM